MHLVAKKVYKKSKHRSVIVKAWQPIHGEFLYKALMVSVKLTIDSVNTFGRSCKSVNISKRTCSIGTSPLRIPAAIISILLACIIVSNCDTKIIEFSGDGL